MVKNKVIISFLLGIFLIPVISSAQTIESLNSNNPKVKWKVTPEQEIKEDISRVAAIGYNMDN